MLPDGTGIAFSRIGMSFFATAYHSAHQFHHCAHHLFRPAHRQTLPRRPWTPSCATSEQHVGAPRHAPLHAPRRSATSERPLCQFGVPVRSATSSATSCATSESQFGVPSVPLRRALCANCHSAVLPARGYPSLFGSQCRLVANCQQRADTTSGIICEEAGVPVAADKAGSRS